MKRRGGVEDRQREEGREGDKRYKKSDELRPSREVRLEERGLKTEIK